MTFLDAIKYMIESPGKEVISSNFGHHRYDNGKFYLKIQENNWIEVGFSRCETQSKWSLPEPAPEEVEVVAYSTPDGVLSFAVIGSKESMAFSQSDFWRKVRVKWGEK